MKALSITAGGASSLIIDVEPELKVLQEAVGGFIQLLGFDNLGDRLTMVMNEEGRVFSLPPNEIASELAGRLIVGDVLVFGDNSGSLADYTEVG